MSWVDCRGSRRSEVASSSSARGEGAAVLTGAIPSWETGASSPLKVGSGILQSKLLESGGVSALPLPSSRAGISSRNWRAFVTTLRG